MVTYRLCKAKGLIFHNKHLNVKYGLLQLHLFLVKNTVNPFKSSIYYLHVKHDLNVTDGIVEIVIRCLPQVVQIFQNRPLQYHSRRPVRRKVLQTLNVH